MADDLFSLPPPSPETIRQLDLRPIELLKEGWTLVRPVYAECLAIFLGATLLNGLFGRMQLVGGLIGFVVSVIAGSGGLYFLVQRFSGREVGLGTVLDPIRTKPVELLVVFLLVGIGVGVGLALLVIPGIVVAAFMMLAVPLALHTRVGVVDALKLSFELVRPRLGEWLILFLALVLVNVLGFLVCVIGLLFTIPASAGAFAVVVARAFAVSRATLPAEIQAPPPP